MAVIVAEAATNLSAAGGFTRTHASNLGSFSTTELSLSTTRTIAFTPAFTENCNGVVLALVGSAAPASMRDVAVTLEENVIGVWTARATQTITASTICNSTATTVGIWYVYFNGGTFPYAVTAAAGTWRFSIASSGSGTHWSLRTSDGTNPFFVAVASTAVTYTDNTDAIVCAAKVTATASATLKGAAVTGDATRSVCCVLCKSSTPTPDSVSMFDISFNTAAIDVVADGLFVSSAHSGPRLGTHVVFTAAPAVGATSATLTAVWPHATGTYSLVFNTGEYRAVTLTNAATTCTWTGGLEEAQSIYGGVGQPVANASSFQDIRATTGTATISGFSCGANATLNSRSSYFFMGEVPTATLEDDTLALDVLEQGNVTITIASPGVVTYTAHGVSNGTPIQLSTTGALPTGLAVATTYYIVNQATNTFQLAATPGGAAINTSGTQSGTHTVVPQIYTTNSTGWVSGDRVYIGGVDNKALERNVYTVSSTSTTQVILTSSLTSNARISCGGNNHAIRFNGYGAKLLSSAVSTGVATRNLGTLANFVVFGCQVQYWAFTTNTSAATGTEDSANRSPMRVIHSSIEGLPAGSISAFVTAPTNQDPLYMDHANFAFMGTGTHTNGGSCNQTIRMKNCVVLTPGPVNAGGQNIGVGYIPVVQNCSFESANNVFYSLSGANGEFSNCYFFGGSSAFGCLRLGTYLNFNHSNNSYQDCTVALNLQSVVTGIETDSAFGTIAANTTDINATTAGYWDVEIASPSGNLIVNTTESSTSSVQQTNGTNIITPGSNLRVSDTNDVANVDTIYQPYGTWVRTGYNLSDTTVWTGTAFGAASAGEFGWRGAPRASSSSTSPLEYEWNFTTGDVTGLTVLVTARVKINSATYYAGTHVKPTLTVTYDNGTETSAVATGTTADQQLSVSFVPTTAYGIITIKISGSTDATGADAYFYIGEIIPSRPPGVSVNTTRLGLFSKAAPLPPDSTFTVPASVWDEASSAHTIAGSFGKLAIDTEIKADDAAVLRGVV